jgi:hypothetical protein
MKTRPGATNYVRHIPGTLGRTYCGRDASKVNCIDLRSDPIDDAECKACQRSDDRRVRESYQREQRALPLEKRDGYGYED